MFNHRTSRGFVAFFDSYCEKGDFYLDPCRPVSRAVLTHAHADHARSGSDAYLAAEPSRSLLQRRLGNQTTIETLAYAEQRQLGHVRVSFHSAGHVLGSAQVRTEHEGEVWVVSGDYKRAADPSCAPFEVVPCHTFVTEATFALPLYRWDAGHQVAKEVLAWWDTNRQAGRASILFCYALGKAQRLLSELALQTDRSVLVHGAVEAVTTSYREQSVAMLATQTLGEKSGRDDLAGELILAPPSAFGSSWMRRFGPHETAFASGWMRLRGSRRRQGYDRGFVLSDHADWPDLLQTIRDTGATSVWTMHGYADVLARTVREQYSIDATALSHMGDDSTTPNAGTNDDGQG